MFVTMPGTAEPASAVRMSATASCRSRAVTMSFAIIGS